MAVTSGTVQQLTVNASLPSVCVWVGPTPTSAGLFFVAFGAAANAEQLAFSRAVAATLARALLTGFPVTITHPSGSAVITGVTLSTGDISPVGQPVHHDFLTITGEGIPDDVAVVFETVAVSVAVTPDLVRPYLVVVADLPDQIPPGRNHVRLEAAGWSSDAVPVDVAVGPRTTVRTLYPGAPRPDPYLFVLVANPAIEAQTGGGVSADPVLTDRPGFHDVVAYNLRNHLTLTEELLRTDGLERNLRWVTIFDATAPATTANALAHELPPNMMETRRTRLQPFVGRYTGRADIVFVLHGSTSHDRATAWFTTDDAAGPSTTFTYDGVARSHGHLPSIPGSAAIGLSVDQTGLTAIHEFGHAASDFNNGRVLDLYVDGNPSTFPVNKKWRTQAGDPIPVIFAAYDGTNFPSDQSRDGLGYPASWRSYHPQLQDATRPNLMDNYWLAFDDPLRCQLDGLTSRWFRDRLRAKTQR